MISNFETEFFDLPRPRVIAHRGASGAYPENTLPAFRAAHAAGAPYLELDVHMTRDGEVLVIHDHDLRRVADHDGVVAELSLAAVAAADAGRNFTVDGVHYPFRGQGIRVPTLREVFAGFPEQRFVVEIKQTAPSLVRPLLEIVERHAMRRRVLIASEHQEPLDEVRALAPSIPTSFSSEEVGRFTMSLAPDAPTYVPHGAALQIPPEHLSWKLVTPESVAAAHRMGVEVHVWTVNDETAMRELLAMGVDGIITDYHARMLELVRQG